MIRLKSIQEINKIETASKIVAELLDRIEGMICKDLPTYELEKFAVDFIETKKALPACKGYHGFPYALCISVNDTVIHGFPSKKEILKEGDLVSVDCVVNKDGFFGDSTKTFVVGDFLTEIDKVLFMKTKESLYNAIEIAIEGNHIGDLGNIVSETVIPSGLSVIKEYSGHGVGLKMHEDPSIPNYGRKNTGSVIRCGMTLAIEPMVVEGSPDIYVEEDGWTVKTVDRKRAAHFEHTVVIEKNGPRILTAI